MVRDRKHKRYCGQLKEFDVESDRKFFRVAFKSNDRLDGTGFNATYQFLDATETYTGKPDQTSSSTCLTGMENLLFAFELISNMNKSGKTLSLPLFSVTGFKSIFTTMVFLISFTS